MAEVLIQKLMDEAYDQWQNNEDWTLQDFRNYIKENLTQQHLIAVQVGNLDFQVEDGGFYQWHTNGYSMDLEDLMKVCEEIETEASMEVRDILDGILDVLVCYYDADEAITNIVEGYADTLRECLEEQVFRDLSEYDDKYRNVSGQFLLDVEKYLRNQMAS